MHQFVDNQVQHFVEIYNSRLKKRYEDDLSTHPDFDPDLWLEGGSPGGPDRNWEYGLPTLGLRTYRRHVMFQSLGAHNRYLALSLQSLRPC